MTTDIDALRASMRAAQVSGKGRYFSKGVYQLEVDKLFYKRTIAEGVTKENIIAEFKILQSSNPEMEPGSTGSVVFAFHHTGWLGRLKALLTALAGFDPDGKIPKEVDDMIVDLYVAIRDESFRASKGWKENFLQGKVVRAEAIPGTSKKGGPVTNMKWAPVLEAA